MDPGYAAIYRLNIQPYQQINQLVESQLKWQKQQWKKISWLVRKTIGLLVKKALD